MNKVQKKQPKFSKDDIVSLHKKTWLVKSVNPSPYGDYYLLEEVDGTSILNPFCHWFDFKGELVESNLTKAV